MSANPYDKGVYSKREGDWGDGDGDGDAACVVGEPEGEVGMLGGGEMEKLVMGRR